MEEEGIYHVPVLLQEVIDGLQIIPSGVYVDCTFGGGGHSRGILKELDATGKLVVFDQDEDARKNVPADERIIFVPHNFRHLQRFLRLHGITTVDGVIADLGVSSHQINVAERGFSTRFDAALDMRMNQQDPTTAFDIIRDYPQEKLHLIFEQYGEVTNSRTLAKTIAEVRKTQAIRTIREFKDAIYPVVKGNPDKYLAQVFQAIRIEVNDEMGALREMLDQGTQVLKVGGRFAIITFHSLEDRMVKNFFRYGNSEGQQTRDVFGNPFPASLKVITRKPVIASPAELKKNPRSRSSKLRIAEKVKISET